MREADEEWVSRIALRLANVRERISEACRRAGRRAEEVGIVAVTKSFPAEVVRAAVAAGLSEIGENRVQEARDKRALLGDLAGVRWHLVGHLQKNKAGLALALFDLIHSVDDVELARVLERRAAALGRTVPVLLEVNVGEEASKFGFPPREEVLFQAVEAILVLPHLRLEGLMTVAPIVSDPEEVRPTFARLRTLRERLRGRFPEAPWTHLSMGMTDDYVVAVEEGATLIRLGRALFGERA
ncbi:MAG: YggS family pyridoxal phosphate-dependent enzyme [Chloroflexia bacterium]